MVFFKNRKKKSKVDEQNFVATTLRVSEIKVATTTIVSSYVDNSWNGPKCVKWYFLVREVDGEFYEIFSNRKIEKDEDSHHNECIIKDFDRPYITEVEPLTNYLRNPNIDVIESQLLFDFILMMNVHESLKTFEENKS